MCAYSVFNTFPVYPLSAKPLILLAFCRYRYHTSLFNRPGFQQMMTDMENGKIRTIITKDLSRLGRNQLHTGLYIEERFPMFGVRYIAINDNVDTDQSESTELMPFKNLFNEWFIRDTSRKIRAVQRAKAERGERLGTRAEKRGRKIDLFEYHYPPARAGQRDHRNR